LRGRGRRHARRREAVCRNAVLGPYTADSDQFSSPARHVSADIDLVSLVWRTEPQVGQAPSMREIIGDPGLQYPLPFAPRLDRALR